MGMWRRSGRRVAEDVLEATQPGAQTTGRRLEHMFERLGAGSDGTDSKSGGDPPPDGPPKNQPPEDQPPEDHPPESQPPEDQPPEDQPPEDHPPEDHPPEDQPPKNRPPENRPPESKKGRKGYPSEDHTSSLVRTRSMVASVNSVVPACPARSGVLMPAATVSSTAS